ncbi:phosphoribosylamine--glycine ligase [Rhodovastum atsumiense]|uniref:Phosphoribosylamine--glycine ligase n=1 Tax=Rhodovastum atsumiense TaxID=504468 RepID=A0A5M6IVA8_9PROT|nr:phosphoribosylamine--glycine ligase [Rhodovastum atsumiense]KAA5611488.1 phosphoribosylamine--glycine ligase [Rhodovastum atsumiense]CAH2601183.1 phosphoribosylamine--glycine ligase [Rhodovastum atsumiense]
MRVLVVGSGGREHALCWALAGSPLLTKLWCAPGNAGTAEFAENVPIGVLDIAALVRFAKEQQVDLVVPGPEAPLVAGLADALGLEGIACCGPSAAAARIEGSKSFTKELCDAAAIPTALWERFDDAEAARAFVRLRGAPIVVKADGLAAGKGVVVAASVAEAEAAIAAFMEEGSLGEAGRSVVIEECLVGEEVSLFALCDGTHAIPLGAAQDHKRVGDGDTGPNTGGMGAYSPPPALPPALEAAAMERIIRPALAELAAQGTPFRGILFAGLMLTADGPKLIEFNARFGDPECQTLLLRLKSDLLAALQAACDGELADFDLRWHDQAAIAVVMAARGYPGEPVKGTEIRGIERAAAVPGVRVFHAGTQRLDGKLVASGGRVLTICATGADLRAARDAAYEAVAALDWPEGFCRRDIGWRALPA